MFNTNYLIKTSQRQQPETYFYAYGYTRRSSDDSHTHDKHARINSMKSMTALTKLNKDIPHVIHSSPEIVSNLENRGSASSKLSEIMTVYRKISPSNIKPKILNRQNTKTNELISKSFSAHRCKL